jgi:transposase
MGHLVMSDKERQRKAWMLMVCEGKVTLSKAREALGVSYRQAKRIYRRYSTQGDEGLIHRSRQRKSNRQHLHKTEILALYQRDYLDFGPTLAAEKLAENGYIVDHETLRRWLLAENLWSKKRNRSPHRQRRERRAQFGDLIQMDGSIHDWFGDGKYDCLINMVDDATGKTLSHLESGETTAGVMSALWKWIEKYGIPMAVYVDLKNVYVSRKEENMCHFERACEKLGIQIIKAYSPQAKGRVERNHAVYQDRFVKELKLKGIKTIEDANKILDDYFIDHLNKKFEKTPANPESAHRPVDQINLNQIFCFESTRQVQHDFTFSFESKLYQIKKTYGCTLIPKKDVIIREHLDGSMSVWYNNQKLEVKAIDKKPTPALAIVKCHPLTQSQLATMNKDKTPWSHDSGALFTPNHSSMCYKGLYSRKGHFHRVK